MDDSVKQNFQKFLRQFRPPGPHMLVQYFGVSLLVTILGVALAIQGKQSKTIEQENAMISAQLLESQGELDSLKAEDQFVRNEILSQEIKNIENTYDQAVDVYEDLLDLKLKTRDTAKLDSLFATILSLLSERQWASATAQVRSFIQGITDAENKLAAAVVIPANIPASNTPPGSGYSRQSVNVDGTNYLLDIVAADLGSTRVIVDTASAGDCFNDCPVLPLADYVARNGAFAGINGSYFCPADYPSCAGKKNTFDTLLMNKNKVYFNSENNVYSTVPAVIFLGGSMRFVGRSLEWGRDTSPDGMIANQPLLLSGGNVTFDGDGDPKKGSRGNRSFVGNKGSIAYIGVVRNATVAEVALVLKVLGLENALNLDDGGSTALWSGGYKLGPGRALPNVILFVRK